MHASRPLRWYDQITLNIYFSGLTTLSQTMTPLIAPLLVQRFVGVGSQGGAYGSLRLWSLMTALLVQALMGMLSDRHRSRWGRRRPFIVIGTLLCVAVLAGIGFTAEMDGAAGFQALFGLILLLMVASNTAHGAVQGLIPDLVPPDQRGRFSGIKALLEAPLPVIFVSLVVGRLVQSGNIRGALLATIAVLLLTMLITLFAPEKPSTGRPAPLDAAPLLQLALMTAAFTALILALGWVIARLGGLLAGAGLFAGLWAMGAAGLAAMLLATTLGVTVAFGLAIRSNPAALSLSEVEAHTPNRTSAPLSTINRAFRWWVINRLAFLIGSTNIASFALYFVQGRLSLSGAEAAGPTRFLLLTVGVFILFVAPPAGRLADRFGSRRLTMLSGLIAALGALALVTLPGLPGLYAGGCLIGAAAGVFYSANWALGTALAPPQEAGRYLGISNLAGAGAGAVGAYLGGPIADFFTNHYPQQPGIGYVLLFAIYGLLFVFSIWAARQIPASAARIGASAQAAVA